MKRQKLRWQIPLLVVLMITLVPLVSNIVTGHYNPFVSNEQGSSLPSKPISTPTSAALKDYLDEAVLIVKKHVEIMAATVDAHNEQLELIKKPRPSGLLSSLTAEEIAEGLFARFIPDRAITTLESSLHQADSYMVDLEVLLPPAEAEAYHDLIVKSFKKDQVALKDWIYYWTLLRDHRTRDMDVLERGNRHYQDAQELRLQAEYELNSLPQKLGQ